MSYEIDQSTAGRVNASNYDIADMIDIINDDEVKTQVDVDLKIKDDESFFDS